MVNQINRHLQNNLPDSEQKLTCEMQVSACEPERVPARSLTHKTDTHDHTSTAHAHVHSEESLRQITNRLSRIEGHIRGIKTMINDSRPCPEVLVQIAAVRGALDRVSRIILDEHLTECLTRAAQEGNIESEIEQLKTALDRFLP